MLAQLPKSGHLSKGLSQQSSLSRVKPSELLQVPSFFSAIIQANWTKRQFSFGTDRGNLVVTFRLGRELKPSTCPLH